MSDSIVKSSRRLVISAAAGNSGKTLISLAIISLLRSKGYAVQPFKKGPDYIDPKWLSAAAGKKCYNLDYYLFADKLKENFFNHIQNDDIAFIEGNHALYDSIDIEGFGSTAHMAKIFNAPLILIVNCFKMSRSVAALINGYQNFDSDLNLCGVILNNCGGKRHREKLINAVEHYCNIPVLGAIDRMNDNYLPGRYIGLETTMDQNIIAQKMEAIVKDIGPSLDMEKIREISLNAPKLSETVRKKITKPSKLIIGVALDDAFNFYYNENLEELERLGGNMVFFSPIKDKGLPEVDALYLGGGYPELFAKELAENQSMKTEIKKNVEKYMPVYGECGGLIYLSNTVTVDSNTFEMVKVFGADIGLTPKAQGRGYAEYETVNDQPVSIDINFFWNIPDNIFFKGHEFHYSKVINNLSFQHLYKVKRGSGIHNGFDGIVYKNCIGSYIHIHALSVAWWAQSFIEAALRYKEWKR